MTKFVTGMLTAVLMLTVLTAGADGPVPSVEADAKKRVVADRLFEQGRYAQALGQYLMAAQEGDKFAMYRLSLMYYFGLVGERDKVEAYAWATVAQEEGMTVLRQYATLIGQELKKRQYEAARTRLEELEVRYGAVLADEPHDPALPRVIDANYVADFNRAYGREILIEFDQFDRQLLAAQ